MDMPPFLLSAERTQLKLVKARAGAFNHSAAETRIARHAIREASLKQKGLSI